jgi:hypothetical protein
MSEDDPTPERCPICKDEKCKIHLLGCFDASGDEGVFGIGLVGGPLSEVKEIEEVLQRAQLAWVQSVRAAGNPEMPQWITKSPSLRYYYDQLGDAGDFDPEQYESDEDAACDLSAHTNFNNMRAVELVEELLNGCGRIEKTKEDYEALMRSTTYVSWWTSDPSEIVERFRGNLRMILLGATQ